MENAVEQDSYATYVDLRIVASDSDIQFRGVNM
jgi:hypothetical protein